MRDGPGDLHGIHPPGIAIIWTAPGGGGLRAPALSAAVPSMGMAGNRRPGLAHQKIEIPPFVRLEHVIDV